MKIKIKWQWMWFESEWKIIMNKKLSKCDLKKKMTVNKK